MVTCPSCGSTFLRRDPLKLLDKLWAKVTDKRPYVCWHCNWRGWFLPNGSWSGKPRSIYGTYPPPAQPEAASSDSASVPRSRTAGE
ncbi:MAG: hypothetical protein U0Q12_17135 [Vicinamibacterales bacterium]